MVLIDREKTIMAGERKIIVAELAATLDRFFAEVEKAGSSSASYDDMINDFLKIVRNAAKQRETGNGSPTNIVLEESLLAGSLFDQKESTSTSGASVDDLLAKAAKKMQKVKNKKQSKLEKQKKQEKQEKKKKKNK